MNSAQQFSAGTVIGDRYRIIKPIGQGGMASVFLAEDLTNGEGVALKVMRDELTNDPEFVRRFATEARAAASLDHPNIVKVLDYGQDGDVRYIVQEYVQGETLKDMIRREGALDFRLATPLMIQIGLALEHAHQREVIHRDMKPQNILITDDMVAKVTDFGIARASSMNTITLTGGVVMGSVHYFSPEQARGGEVTTRSDLYSLGIIFYEMLTGELPFDGESSVAIAIKHLQEFPPPPSYYEPELPKALDDIVGRAIQKNPAARYRSAREFIDELDAFMVDPNGVYGVIPQTAQRSEPASTSALGVPSRKNNYNKVRDIDRTYNKRRSSRYRDTAIVVTVSAVAIVLLALLTIWLVKNFSSNEKPTVNTEITLDNFTGKEIDEDEVIERLNELQRAGMEIELLYRVDESVLEGIIFRQEPESDGSLKIRPQGQKLTLYISSGQDSVVVPEVEGDTRVMAEQKLRTEGFLPYFTPEFSDTIPKDIVIRTVPSSGSELPRGENIEVIYSSGPENVRVPDVQEMPIGSARSLIEDKGLLVGSEISYTGDPIPENDKYVIKQSPAPGTEVPARTPIILEVGTYEDLYDYKNPTTTSAVRIMPKLEGKTQSAVDSLLSSLGVLEYSVQRWPASSSGLNPNTSADKKNIYILAQNIEAGTEFTPNKDAIVLTWGDAADYEAYTNPTPATPPVTDPAPDPTTEPATDTPNGDA
ncbi:MAG: Stk1 family PASTA domain-containing Ser/Thr kinase [Clostridiaceae bacterium]|nr:Stk1 family PASTA domain-containing Ser/Thr kinase [Clostridiaceae bacterium]